MAEGSNRTAFLGTVYNKIAALPVHPIGQIPVVSHPVGALVDVVTPANAVGIIVQHPPAAFKPRPGIECRLER